MSLPAVVAACLFLAAVALVVGGVYILVGAGWAMISGALPLFIVAAVLARGA